MNDAAIIPAGVFSGLVGIFSTMNYSSSGWYEGIEDRYGGASAFISIATIFIFITLLAFSGLNALFYFSLDRKDKSTIVSQNTAIGGVAALFIGAMFAYLFRKNESKDIYG